jgi:hypothetical protein
MAQSKEKAPELDLDAIQNKEAIERTGTAGFDTGKKRKSGRFNFVEAESIKLPSEGRLYKHVDDSDIKKGYIKMYPMTVKEEEILSTQRFLKSGVATRMVIDNCIASDIEAKDILLFDSNYLLFYLRSISYGDEYTFNLKCVNAVCEREFSHTVKISELEFDELPEDIKEPIEIKLPKSKYLVRVVLPRLYHSEEIYRRNINRKKSTTDADQRLVDNLMATTVEILDPEGEVLSQKYWEEFYESIPSMDRATLKDQTDFSTGVDEIQGVECPYCGTDYSGTIPIGVDFFRF